MTTHYHLLIDVDDDALPMGMHSLNFRHAVEFNRRHRMKGHVIGARYDSVRIEGESHLLGAYRYVMRNPVEAGICATAEAWRWSSFAAAVAMRSPSILSTPPSSSTASTARAKSQRRASEHLLQRLDTAVTGPGPVSNRASLANGR
jgi:hypothetical protein